MKRVLGALALNQGADDDDILEFKSSDVAHGVTTIAETNTFGRIRKTVGASGGLLITGITEGNAGAVQLAGIVTTEDTTKSIAGVGVVQVEATVKSGTSDANPGANTNIFAVRAGSNTRFIMDADGDSHQDIGTAWTNFDAHNDVALLTQLSVQVSRPDDPIRTAFRSFLELNRGRLEALGLVTFNDDGHHFINWSRTNMLLIGAVRQLHGQLEGMGQQLHLLTSRMHALESK